MSQEVGDGLMEEERHTIKIPAVCPHGTLPGTVKRFAVVGVERCS